MFQLSGFYCTFYTKTASTCDGNSGVWKLTEFHGKTQVDADKDHCHLCKESGPSGKGHLGKMSGL